MHQPGCGGLATGGLELFQKTLPVESAPTTWPMARTWSFNLEILWSLHACQSREEVPHQGGNVCTRRVDGGPAAGRHHQVLGPIYGGSGRRRGDSCQAKQAATAASTARNPFTAGTMHGTMAVTSCSALQLKGLRTCLSVHLDHGAGRADVGSGGRHRSHRERQRERGAGCHQRHLPYFIPYNL